MPRSSPSAAVSAVSALPYAQLHEHRFGDAAQPVDLCSRPADLPFFTPHKTGCPHIRSHQLDDGTATFSIVVPHMIWICAGAGVDAVMVMVREWAAVGARRL
jgi:hypothetical protein